MPSWLNKLQPFYHLAALLSTEIGTRVGFCLLLNAPLLSVTNESNQANKVWVNDGSSNFTDSGQPLGSSWSRGLSLDDVDDNGNLSAFVGNWNQANISSRISMTCIYKILVQSKSKR